VKPPRQDGVAQPRSPHAATLDPRQRAGIEPHAATVAQPREAQGLQRGAAGQVPPHPATVAQPRAAHPAHRFRHGAIQRMAGPSIYEIGFTQSSISPKFTNGQHLDAVIDKLERGTLDAEDFPPLQIFTITDPWDGAVKIYSLSNRRLYVFKKARVIDFPHATASFDDVVGSTYEGTWTDRLRQYVTERYNLR
jgi:hypothetical protein